MGKMKKKGLTGDAIVDTVIWIVFLAVAGAAVYFLIKRLSA